ncbi:MAG TPA: NUDIX domain-containing protein [Candidatus Marinimicrobia bacterium]|jgi:dATP pyrophosphohydrolase|nr:NUDIX hydrolase [Candidatus Neomarinimicrobiota bacterium]MDP6276127.1 NUDIX domain-containing protein [Candidatus Neomarinimicrobiota bacterium]MDP7217400.1 NUDIX domain-containing protein [Candidatus Neomarinimicrobiota bacterium]MDP7436573.1 NUDIX domain-containing protein [Candidatus Neomarinimicrobiota bacterium]HJL74102.1 NUDIX domain-containing protein [Candidatus Neomarinimicrobiota bacterium]
MSNIVVRVVDAYVFRKTDDGLLYLILKRAKTKRYEHLWQGVAGKIEAGESAPKAAKRELLEETGLKPKHMFVADHVSRFYEAHGDRINLVPVFGIEVDSDQITLSDEHCEYKWVTIEETLDHLVWRGQKQGIQVVNEMVLKNDDRLRWSTID